MTVSDAHDAVAPGVAAADAILPCPHFEGVEKRIEIDFHEGSSQRGTSSPAFPTAARRRRRRKKP